MGTSVNTAVSPPMLFARKVINDIEEQQRKTLKDTVEGNIRLTNTSPTLQEEGKEEEVIISSSNPQAGNTQADIQEETLQLESSKVEDTGLKQVHRPYHQNVKLKEIQNKRDINEEVVTDPSSCQIEENGTIPTNTNHDCLSDDQDPAIPDDQTSKTSQNDNYHTAIYDDDLDDTILFGNLVTEPFLLQSIRVQTTEVGCLSFTQMFQDYLHACPSP